MERGELRVYLGAGPGVGKTYAMLAEARRRAERGTDVVVGIVETHGRPHTVAMLEGLEVVPRRSIDHRGAGVDEMDLDAVLTRRPEVAVVDELAHSNAPGSRHAKRWQDIQELLDAGITVLTTVNIGHLESLTDVAHEITGGPRRQSVPDQIVRAAEQVELVDMTPEALRRRVAHGDAHRPEAVDAAPGTYCRTGTLTALRELALLWLAGGVDAQLDRYRAEHGIVDIRGTRERIVVALTGGPEGETLIRRAARVAARGRGTDLLAVHVARSDGLVGADPARLGRQRVLVESLGGTYHQVVGADVPAALLDFARGVNATQIVLGASRRARLAQMLSPGVGMTTIARSGSIDVHLVNHDEARQGRRPAPAALSRRRRLAGFLLAAIGLPALTLLLPLAPELSLTADILLFLAMVVAVALFGGLWPALVAAVGASVLLNYFFTPPLYTLTVARVDDLLALAVFVVVAVAVSGVVDLAARRTRQAARASADAQTLATIAGSVLRGARPLDALLEQMRDAFGLASVTLLERGTAAGRSPDAFRDPAEWRPAAAVGEPACTSPVDGDVEVPIDDRLTLVLRGRVLPAADRRIVEAFAAQAAVALRQQRLAAEAAAARPLAEADRMRTALLAAVSHDLRTPLASAKAAVASLRSTDVEFDAADRAELLATAEESLDRLARLVANLLDMSRLQAGALGMSLTAVGLEDVVPRALDELGGHGHRVAVRLPDGLPLVRADPGLLDRVLVNVIGNALRHSPPDRPPVITASGSGDTIHLRVTDYGPGISEDHWDEVFLPFQRLGDRDNHTGVGLGLALSRGLTEAMSGTLRPEATPGGGLTMVVSLPADSNERVTA